MRGNIIERMQPLPQSQLFYTPPAAAPGMANELSEKVELSGFKDIDDDAMNDVNRIVSAHIKRYMEICRGFEKLLLKMKKVHAQEHSEKYEINAALIDNGRMYTSTITDKNLLSAVDAVLEKIEHEIGEK